MSRYAEYQPDAHGTDDGSVVVRRAVAQDAAAIVAVDATREPRPASYLDRVAGQLAREDAIHVVAEHVGEVIGTSAVKIWPQPTDAPAGWYVSGITVVPWWRRRRVADRLLALELGSPELTGEPVWSVVNAGNRASLDLHARHGFVEVARAATFAGIEFTGGAGVLLRREPGGG
ncbi:GNAT family N-acetyltransferase [Actinotalea sp. M2MS4P-6]|uniref:GNAT family N-acetyltransferase n=1 Tax=Actinotalea sp. M2MS4P-6 TaxID=2983762 RepID=UPI0021E3718B|nr:GNAT family N-acetyltransferase [Actinotalea sp. M2MS4P-6]MCV2392952.1 GNAT family N-acetyltransferase [Actinotalea sp. M2MS4P-6]